MDASLPLKNKWIANTRAEHQAQPLTKKLLAAGANVIHFPLLSIEPPKNLKEVEQQLALLGNYDLAVFISSNAVEQTLNKIDARVLKTLKLACVGEKTGLVLKAHDLKIDFCPKQFFNSEALLALDAFQKFIPGKKIALIKGHGGRKLLEKSLRKWGGDINTIEVYRRTCPNHNIDFLKKYHQHQELDIIILTSGFSVCNFFTLAGNLSDSSKAGANNKEDWIDSLTLLLGSERLQKYVPDNFKGRVIFAEDPSDETLLKELSVNN